MRRLGWLAVALSAASLFAGCGDEPQTLEPRRNVDTRAHDGAVRSYTAGDWQAGDATAWEKQMRIRAQYQNEYGRLAP